MMTSEQSDTTPTLEDRVTALNGEDDHFLRHVSPDEDTFKARHQRHVNTKVTDTGIIVHEVIESYDSDAHGDSLSWKRIIPSGSCPICNGGTLDTDTDYAESQYTETATCDTCPFTIRQASVRAEYDSPEDKKPMFYRASIPHDFDEDPDISWENLKETADVDDLTELGNVARLLYLSSYVGRIRDKAYDSDEKTLETFTCGNCESTVEVPARKTHPYYGDVCPECEDAKVWTPEDADLPTDVTSKMDEHASFSREKITALLRDAIYYADYKRTRLDPEDDLNPEDISEGVTTGKGGKIDAQGMGRGQKGTGLRRPEGGPFHNNAHWRTLLADAKETGLIKRADSLDCDDEASRARWVATEKGRRVFDELSRCQTCGDSQNPYNRVRIYQTQGKYSNKDSSLTLACPDCEQMSSQEQGMTIASSTGNTSLQSLDGVNYE